MLARLRQPWPDRRAELVLGALASFVLVVIGVMVVSVFLKAWPTFQHNGLAWLGSGGEVDRQLDSMVNTGAVTHASDYHLRA